MLALLGCGVLTMRTSRRWIGALASEALPHYALSSHAISGFQPERVMNSAWRKSETNTNIHNNNSSRIPPGDQVVDLDPQHRVCHVNSSTRDPVGCCEGSLQTIPQFKWEVRTRVPVTFSAPHELR